MILPASLRPVIERLGGHAVLVVGDICLDEYLVGTPERLSREAPVPVLEFTERMVLPGAAANPARNIVALGSRATLVATIGDDETGQALLGELTKAGIDGRGLVTVAGEVTTRKTRVLAHSGYRLPQQLVRIDHNPRVGMAPPSVAAITARIRELAPEHDAILVSDYRNGIVSGAVIDAVREAGSRLATVDSQGDLLRFSGFAVVKANLPEAEATLRAPLRADADIEREGAALVARLGVGALVITRGAAGLSLVEAGGAATHIPATNQSEVFDVTGAGDTVIAVMTLALLAGATGVEAATLANYAAGLVVRRLGNATTSRGELAAALPAE